MYYVIPIDNPKIAYGPFLNRKEAYDYVAENGGITKLYVLSDSAMQQMLYREIIKP